MHGIHVVEPGDCAVDASLGRQPHEALDWLQVRLLVRGRHVGPFDTCLDILGRASGVASRGTVVGPNG